jgi:N4-gp56 family major capsid protein
VAILSNLATTITAPINFVLMKGLLRAAERVLPYYNGVLPGSLERNQGTLSVKWRRLDNLAANTTPLTELTGNQTATFFGRTAASPTFTDITATVQKYGDFIPYTEELDFTNVNSRAAALFDKLGEQAGHSLNVLMATQFNSGTNIRFAGSVASNTLVASAIGLADVQAAVNFLARNSAMKQHAYGFGRDAYNNNPIRASYFGIAHVDMENDIRALTGFIPAEQYGGYTPLNVGEFGAVGGVRWTSTEIAPVTTDISTVTGTGFRGTGTNFALWDVYNSVIYGKESVGAVGLGTEHAEEIYTNSDRNPGMVPAVQAIAKPVGSSGAIDPFNEVGTLAWKAHHASAILNQNWLVPVRTLCTSHAL